VLLTAVLVLAGCSQNLAPTTYTDEVKANYQENCVKGASDKMTPAAATAYCECTYTGFVDNVIFDKFKEFETYLRDHVGNDVKTAEDLRAKYPEIVALLSACIVAGPVPASAVTTIPSTTAPR
jgi:hypothetical protein